MQSFNYRIQRATSENNFVVPWCKVLQVNDLPINEIKSKLATN